MVCLPFNLRNLETAADSGAGYVCESKPESDSISKSTAIAFRHCRVPVVGDSTVATQLIAAGTSTLWVSTNVTKDADSDCSGTITGTLLYSSLRKRHLLS